MVVYALFWFLALQMAPAVDFEELALPDESAFVQRGVHLTDPPLDISPWIWRSTVRTLILKFYGQLQTHQDTLEEQRERADRLNRYVDKVKLSLGRKGTLFADMNGLVPAGPMDEADQEVARMLLGLFRTKHFAMAVLQGVEDIGQAVRQYRWRSEKKVADLVVASADTTEDQLPRLLQSFFANQHHLISDFLATVRKGLTSSIEALPANHTFMNTVAGQAAEQILGAAMDELHNSSEIIMSSHGVKFCGHLGVQFTTQFLPVANQTVNALGAVCTSASASNQNDTELAKPLTLIAEALSEVSQAIAVLAEETSSWVEKVCGLVGASAEHE
mmetsp:Transcript_11995/g.28116  ORF Transcript_11995/g.28116 Transcript_11995/m.28116 type:complete len:331 (-) Transcript_11995:38-1030(-)